MRSLLLLILASFSLNAWAQPAEPNTLPYPEDALFTAPRSPSIYLNYELEVVDDPEMGATEYHKLNSPEVRIDIPPLERWRSVDDKNHSIRFDHPLMPEVDFTVDCYPIKAWPEIDETVMRGRVNAIATELMKDKFTHFKVFTMEKDFTATPPTKKLKMANGTEVEVLKRGVTKPFRVADQFLYELLAQKIDKEGEVLEEYLLYESICVHPEGYLIVIQLRGSPSLVATVKPWLGRILLNARLSKI